MVTSNCVSDAHILPEMGKCPTWLKFSKISYQILPNAASYYLIIWFASICLAFLNFTFLDAGISSRWCILVKAKNPKKFQKKKIFSCGNQRNVAGPLASGGAFGVR